MVYNEKKYVYTAIVFVAVMCVVTFFLSRIVPQDGSSLWGFPIAACLWLPIEYVFRTNSVVRQKLHLQRKTLQEMSTAEMRNMWLRLSIAFILVYALKVVL